MELLTLAILFLQILCLFALALAYHKLSGAVAAHRQATIATTDNAFRQVEALISIYAELGLRHALPPARGWAASPDFLRNLVIYALTKRPCTIVECSSGLSTIVLAHCAKIVGQGHVYSLEDGEEFAQRTQEFLHLHDLEHFASVLHAPLVPTSLPGWSGKWYAHDALPRSLKIDLLVIDGPSGHNSRMARYPALPLLHERLSPHAAVFLDDATRKDEQAAVEKWLEEFPDLAQIDVPRCEKGCVALIKQPSR